ncbi:MAG TPA: hypothetical protein VGM63_05240, partial [Mucilaginibacter sp.]
IIDMPKKNEITLEAPFDGQIKGQVSDAGHTASYTGILFNGKLSGSGFKAQLSINTSTGEHFTGRFEGSLDIITAKFKGTFKSLYDGKKTIEHKIEGCLRPSRVVNIGQYYKGEAFGGFSMQVQVPLPQGSCFEELPPTDVYVSTTTPGEGKKGDRKCIEGAGEIIKCLDIKERDVCSVKLKSVLVEIKFKDEGC